MIKNCSLSYADFHGALVVVGVQQTKQVSGYHNFFPIDTLNPIVVCCGSRPVHYRVLTAVQSSTHWMSVVLSHDCDSKNVSSLPNVPWRAELLQVRTTELY